MNTPFVLCVGHYETRCSGRNTALFSMCPIFDELFEFFQILHYLEERRYGRNFTRHLAYKLIDGVFVTCGFEMKTENNCSITYDKKIRYSAQTIRIVQAKIKNYLFDAFGPNIQEFCNVDNRRRSR